MRKDTPVGSQLPEWKKEVAEKVKAYGERKKRLTTPPYPLKGDTQEQQPREVPVKQSIPLAQEQVSLESAKKTIPDELKLAPATPFEVPVPPCIEIWTDDIRGLSEEMEGEEAPSVAPFLLRRSLAAVIDHTILILLSLFILFGFSAVMGESIKWLMFSSWKGTLALFLLMHFFYHLYFFRASRQTPGMLFLSLELRDPVISVIPMEKIIVRWFSFVLLNIFNILPMALGKKVLLHDRLSGTEIRSFS